MADDLKGKLETEVELKSSAHEFFNYWRGQVHQTPNHTPANVQEIKLHEGDWESSGSIKIWHYTLDGKPGVFKERIEIDEENKIVKLIGLEGDVFKFYKVYNGIWDITPKAEGCSAKLTIEYEKLNETSPDPHVYLDFITRMTKDIDAGLVQA